MARYVFEGSGSGPEGRVDLRIILFHFQDENATHIIYAPLLDLSGYGKSLEDAKESFIIAMDDFIDYTMKKKTLGKVLKNLGWTLKGSLKKPRKIVAPSIADSIKDNEHVSNIFDTYQVNTFHENVSIPAFA